MTKMGEQIDARMKRIEDALNVDEALQARADEIEELKDKSSHKGIHFENDAVDALQDTADVLGDRIEHTGGSGEGASRSKVGDIVIVIQHQGVPEMRIAIEAKAGSISRKKLIEQVRNGVTNRRARRESSPVRVELTNCSNCSLISLCCERVCSAVLSTMD